MITSPSAYDAPDFDAGFMNDKRDMAPMGESYVVDSKADQLTEDSMGLH